MWKVIVIMGLVAVPFAITASFGTAGPIVEGCLFEHELWGSVDGTKFYYCIGNNMSVEQTCPTNTFFVRNETLTGCVPDTEKTPQPEDDKIISVTVAENSCQAGKGKIEISLKYICE